MAYQTLYRKYRPQRFADLVGQEHVVTALRNAVRDHRVGHAYLFSGPRGTGKTTTARILAKALNCTNLGADGDPCGVCESCTAIADGTSLDVNEVDAASKSRVEEMRDLLERVAYLSAGGGRKVYILDEVHMLSASAEAALLKTLEESPEHVVFVLATTDPLKVAPTIRSRTQHYEFSLYSVEQIQEHLAAVCEREGIAAEPEALALIARAAAGSMRDSLSLLDQAIAHGDLGAGAVAGLLGPSPFAGRVALLQSIVDEDVAGALVGLGELLSSGYDPRRVAEDLLTTARDAFLLVAGRGRVEVDGPADEVERLRTLGDDAGPAQLVRVIETVGQAVVDMRGADAADPRLVLEVALVRLARRDAGPPLQVLAERVERLERRADNPTVRPAASAPSRPDPNAIEPPVEAVNRPRPPRSLGAMREDRAVQVPPDAPATAPPDASAALPAEAGAAETAPAPAAVATEARAVSLDDVIVAWAAVLPRLPPATRAAAQEAQPIALEGGVVTFGIPKNLIGAARPRFHKERDNIREALTEQLGALLKFQLVELAGFGELPPQGSSASGGGDEDVVDLTEIDGAVPADVAVDSVGLLTQRFDATVVEERPRD